MLSASLSRVRGGDSIANQYYDGLVRLHHPSRQRKRSVVDAYKDKRGGWIPFHKSKNDFDEQGGRTFVVWIDNRELYHCAMVQF